jgi:hypothetical protein
MALALRHPIHWPRQRAVRRRAVTRATRLAVELVALAAIVVTVLALTAMGRPAKHSSAGVTPSVAIIDAVCITNTPTQAPC